MTDYRVRPNDTLSGIANQSKVTLGALEKANPQIRNPNVLHVGELVHLPDSFQSKKSGSSVPKKNLEYGQRGPAVHKLQNCLVKAGYLKQSDMNTGPGVYGPHTAAAVNQLQQKYGLPPNAGKNFGPLTRAALEKALAGHTQPHQPQPGPTPAPTPGPTPAPHPPDSGGYVQVPPGIRQPRWTPQQAVAWAKEQVKHPSENYYEKCDHFAAACYGYGGSGYTSAASHWASIPSSMRHPGNTNPPAGALVFWTGGSHGFGHAAISLGNGMIASTDIRRHGMVDIVPLSEIHAKWGLNYAGWAPPYLNSSWGVNPHGP